MKTKTLDALAEIEDIENEQQALGFKEDAWLRKQGWKYVTLENSCWYWCKEINGFKYVVNKATAINMANHTLHRNLTTLEADYLEEKAGF